MVRGVRCATVLIESSVITATERCQASLAVLVPSLQSLCSALLVLRWRLVLCHDGTALR